MSNFSRIVCLLLLQICLIVNSGAGFSQTDGDPGSQDLDVVQVDFFAPADGGEDVGYRKSTYEELGVWGDKQILDTPYSMFVISEKLIENTQARNPEQVFKMNPLTMSSVFDINMISNITTRGFGSSHMLINGIPSDSLALGVFLEDVSSVEIMSGLNGFLYGAGNVGGVLNYVLKRPTQETLRKISLGNYGGQQYYGHADFGGKIDKDGKFAYRFNVFKQGGETNIENQELDRFLISGALDIKPNDDLLIQLNGSYGQYHLNGRQTQFWTGDVGLPFIPEPMDGSKLWGPDDTFNDVDSLNLGVGIKYKINDMFKLRMAFNHRKDSRKMLYTTASSFVNNNTEYQFSIMAENAVRTSEGGYFYIDSEFPTGPVSHNVTLGFNGYKQTTKNSVFDTPTGRTNWPSTAAYQFSIHDYNASNLKAFNWYQYESGKKKSNVSSNLNFLLA
ncbi:MAG: TonB-dependent receptor plug domain-containing protein, partial [Deltaproteobacteria bacterium]|nr:TonB-dependent receptor plug domain-containing protein [Deltaproteobacteria bacterium]